MNKELLLTGTNLFLTDEEIRVAKAEAERLSWTHKAHPIFEKEKCLLEVQLAKVEPLIRAGERKQIGDYMADKKKYGHLNSLVIADLMERLQTGKSPTGECEK